MQATPIQLVFGRDTILNVKHEANCKCINERKDKIIKKKNENENKKRKLLSGTQNISQRRQVFQVWRLFLQGTQ
jgi:hypothetical protein